MYNSSMTQHIKSLFDAEEVALIEQIVNDEKSRRKVYVWDEFSGQQFPQGIMDDSEYMVQNVSLGKIMFNLSLPDLIRSKLVDVAKAGGFDVNYFCATYTEYSAEYGKPVLTPHKDMQNFCLIDYQLDANTSWPLFVEDDTFDLEVNDGLMFLPSKMMHGRPDKVFTDGEYVKMIFFDMKLVNE